MMFTCDTEGQYSLLLNVLAYDGFVYQSRSEHTAESINKCKWTQVATVTIGGQYRVLFYLLVT